MSALTLIAEMTDAARAACEALRERIADVKYAGAGITFTFDGKPFKGELRGRNADVVLGFNAECDRAIALRVMLDGHAKAMRS